MITAGIDAGSRAIKVVLLDARQDRVLAAEAVDQGVQQDALATELFDRLLSENGLGRGDVCRIVATGYGRNLVSLADTTITEITCHAAGVRRVKPEARSVIDIGGQDSKVMRLDAAGGVRDFAMNDRCAAGTGRFLEVVAQRLGVRLDELGERAGRSRSPAFISSTCVVFAETEIVGLLASGTSPEDIAAGVLQSFATRVAAMAGRGLEEPIVFTGGVALVPGMAAALTEALGRPVEIAPDPRMTGALGAAILAARHSPSNVRNQ
ncbi:MAG TPA: acyl-CoA dehydratase activase [Phycisphaerae bacterium]|jgi:predicted CoA-substrate-specific enzyme activase|nr:2-hydroxyglutaryl-CoA dehydratase [Phycisphaerae bacterium]HOB76803.1 acyl-CoA dehydratase activase [Phycisphaerae bacterium]HOJ53525.1 acyl-CoA dehydratase activase [Phycisphaerae bacterium]HOL25318.1 acyl-CoA dehydratase activase [Phycisphaerae bacterium]HPU32185.1 acyl-CoA dehydratase activase [Phycisphaerae bacterium]